MIRFDSEASLESCFVEHFNRTGEDPILNCQHEKLIQQPEFGPYGRGDLLYLSERDRYGNIYAQLIELKNEPLKVDHLLQICRYRASLLQVSDIFDFDCILVGPSPFDSNNGLCYALQEIEWLSAYTFSMDFQKGVSFKQVQGWYPNSDKEDVETIEEIMGGKANVYDFNG